MVLRWYFHDWNRWFLDMYRYTEPSFAKRTKFLLKEKEKKETKSARSRSLTRSIRSPLFMVKRRERERGKKERDLPLNRFCSNNLCLVSRHKIRSYCS